MLNRLLLALICLLYGCGADDNKAAPVQETPARWGELQHKASAYRFLVQQRQDENGWFTDDCDSLLWNSLGAVAWLEINLLAARDEDGDWFRTPDKDCFATGRSGSTISKDMLLGLAFYAVYRSDLGILDGVLRRGRKRGYIMGEGSISRTWMTPSLQAVYAEAVLFLGGERFEPEIDFPQIHPPGLTGYQAHLQVLNILLRYKTVGGASDVARERIANHAARNQRNALFSFAYHLFFDGDFTEPVALLLDSATFPDDRLPTSADRCEPWLWQRDLDDWEPCPERAEQHHGVDLLFVTKLIAESLK